MMRTYHSAIAAILAAVLTAIPAVSIAGGQDVCAAPPSVTGEVNAPGRAGRILRELWDSQSRNVLVVAHRGDHIRHVENSLAAIEGSIELGADVIELDFARTADGAYILMHDSTVDRTTNGTGKLTEMTLAEVRALRLEKAARVLADQRVPTLAETIEAIRGRVMVNVDLKSGDIREIAAEARDLGGLDHLIFKRHWERLDGEMRSWLAANPDVIFMPQAWSRAEVESALTHGAKPAFEIKFKTLTDGLGTRDAMAWMRGRGTRAWINTLGGGGNNAGWSDFHALGDPDAVWGAAIDQGATMIQTDFPSDLVRYLERRGLRTHHAGESVVRVPNPITGG